MIKWLEDKEKDGEVFSNSECFTYVVKYFVEDRRVELWGEGNGISKEFKTDDRAYEVYKTIKTLDYHNIWRETKKMME